MIKRIKIRGFRGKNLDLEFSPLTVVIGANTAGKTTVADAIRWGLLGYIPGMSAPPRGWTELIGNGAAEASVELKLAKGSVTRKLWLEKGSPKINGLAEQGYDEVNVLCLDPSKFLEATGPERAQLVAEATENSFDWKALVPSHLAGPDMKNWASWPNWMNIALEATKLSRSHLAMHKKTLGATVRGLESLRGIVIEDDASLKAKLDQGKEMLGSLKEQLRAVTVQIANVKDAPSPQKKLDVVLRALQDFMGRDHDADTYEERWKDCEARYNERLSKPPPFGKSLDDLRFELQQARSALAGDVARLEHLGVEAKKLTQKYKELKKLKRCPTCGSAGKGLSEAIKLAEATETERLSAEVVEATKESKESETQLEAAAKRLETAEEYYQKGVELEEERLKLMDEGKLIQLWKEHDQLLAEVSEQTQQYDLQGLEQRRYDIECEMEDQEEQNQETERELQTIGYKRSQKKQLDEVEAELVKAENAWTVENDKVKQLEELRDRLTAMSLTPILETLGRFTKGIFDQPLSLDGTELGRLIGSRWVPLTQFSGSEQAVAIAALSCALRGNPDAENLVLADELSSFDDAHLSVFLANVHQAIKAGVLDQFIGFTTPRKSAKAIIEYAATVTL